MKTQGPRTARLHSRALRTLRAYRGLTQTQLAKRAGYAMQTVSRWENAEFPISLVSQQALAGALRVDHSVFQALATEGDPLPLGLMGFSELAPDERQYTMEQVVARLHMGKDGVVQPRRENLRLLFEPADLEKLSDWRRERAVHFRSRLRGLLRTHRPPARRAATA